MIRHISILIILLSSLVACGGGGDGGGNTQQNDTPVNLSPYPAFPSAIAPQRPVIPVANPAPFCSAAPTGADIQINGRVTFEKIPHFSNTGLDYANTINAPARGITVQALANDSTILDSTTTDANGNYTLTVPDNTGVRVLVVAELVQNGTPGWNFRVVDNTDSKTIYSAIGPATCTSIFDETRDLHAPSGWTGSSYGSDRVAAPFNIIDAIYEDVQLVLSANPNFQFSPLNINWSINNRPANGINSDGNIGTSHFDGAEIYLLGDEDNDTDEYDDHIISHEWAHYFEFNYSRFDSIGGPHSLGDRLDMRVAFGEGFGNAVSAMSTNDPLYSDTMGINQSSGFNFNVETNTNFNAGWYNEASVQSILYDIYDSNDDGNDFVSLGFAPIFDTMTIDQAGTTYLASIFTFVDGLKFNVNNGDIAAIDFLVEGQNINSTSINEAGSNETNNAGNSDILPVYYDITVNGSSVNNICVTDNFMASSGDYNKLGVHKFIRFTVSNPGDHFIRVEGPSDSDPDIAIISDFIVGLSESLTPGLEYTRANLGTGVYIIDLYDFNLIAQIKTGRSCFTVSVTN